jgi:hypothetical protein
MKHPEFSAVDRAFAGKFGRIVAFFCFARQNWTRQGTLLYARQRSRWGAILPAQVSQVFA